MELYLSYDEEFSKLIKSIVAKYGTNILDIDGIGSQTDIANYSKSFFNSKVTSDSSIDANANVDDVSIIAYQTEMPKPLYKLNSYYLLWSKLKKNFNTLYANYVMTLQIKGDIYINDCNGIAGGLPYCFNYSTYDLMQQGLPMVKKIKSKPPKHLFAFKSQLEQFVVIAANSTLGACGLADMLVVMSYYVKNILNTKKDAHFTFATEEDCMLYIKETLISFIYTINQPMRGNQSAFTNISFYDDNFLKEMRDNYVFPDDSKFDIEIVKKLQIIFIDAFVEELKRTPITFPIQTACFSIDENNDLLDLAFVDLISEKNLQFGQINLYCGKSSTVSSCCRLRSDGDNEYFNSFGSGSTKIGSIGVVTINLPRIAYTNRTDEDFLIKLSELVAVATDINNVKREIVKERISNGNHPLYEYGFCDINKQYSTVGINGFNEAIKIIGYDPLKKEGMDFGLMVINTINSENKKCEKRLKTPHNCEQIPAENVSIKLAEKDKELGYNSFYSLYSNQFIPLTQQADLLDRIHIQGLYDKHFTGGAIMHLNVETSLTEKTQLNSLIKVAAKAGVIYFAVNNNIQECEEGHITAGINEHCEMCGSDIINNFTRVVGFLVNTKNFHKVRREKDYPRRKWYKVTDI
jgi:ribonucleoside-triphosphate reductase (formate)